MQLQEITTKELMFLIVSLVALMAGPVVVYHSRISDRMMRVLQWIIFILVVGIMIFDIIPQSVEFAGNWAIVAVALGMLSPVGVELLMKRAITQIHRTVLLLAVLGLTMHTLLDGMALTATGDHHHHSMANGLPLAVVLHRFPVGMTVWLLVSSVFSNKTAKFVLGFMALVTIGGFLLGHHYLARLENQWTAMFQALVSGSLMHVILHQKHDHH